MSNEITLTSSYNDDDEEWVVNARCGAMYGCYECEVSAPTPSEAFSTLGKLLEMQGVFTSKRRTKAAIDSIVFKDKDDYDTDE